MSDERIEVTPISPAAKLPDDHSSAEQFKANYMWLLHKTAQRKLATLDLTKQPIDPQGRILIDVTVEELRNYCRTALKKDLPALGEDAGMLAKMTEVSLLAQLAHKASMTLPAATTVSIDGHSDAFLEKLKPHLQRYLEDEWLQRPLEVGEISEYTYRYNELSKGSIIPAQEEFHYHLGLTKESYKKIFPDTDNKKLETAYKDAMLRVNQELILPTFAEALVTSRDVNSVLDGARVTNMSKAHEILVGEMKKQGLNLPEALQKFAERKAASGHKKVSASKILKELTASTPATPNDVLFVSNNLATLIQGSTETAHHMRVGTDFAHREIITHSLDVGGRLRRSKPNIVIRTPSLAYVKAASDEVRVQDVADKLGKISTSYTLGTRLSGKRHSQRPKAFSYLLLTTLDERFDRNKQSKSAKAILQGAHQYNRTKAEPYCFVQNISVNGFGKALGHGSSSLMKEATLMADISLLHTVFDDERFYTQGDKLLSDPLKAVMSNYRDYLADRDCIGVDFHDTKYGENAKTAIVNLKTYMRSTQPTRDKSISMDSMDEFISVDTLTKQRLKELFVHNLHYSHENAKLTQSLSSFVVEGALVGCKSGNERTGYILGRKAVLERLAVMSIDEIKADPIYKNLYEQLLQPIDSPESAKALNDALDVTYDAKALYLEANVIANVDMGASSKVKIKTWFFGLFNPNYTESSNLKNLQQGNVDSMQAHKGLAPAIGKSWGMKESFASRYKSKKGVALGLAAGGLIAVVATGVLAPIALVGLAGLAVGAYAYHKNENRINKKRGLKMPEVVVAATVAQTVVAPVQFSPTGVGHWGRTEQRVDADQQSEDALQFGIDDLDADTAAVASNSNQTKTTTPAQPLERDIFDGAPTARPAGRSAETLNTTRSGVQVTAEEILPAAPTTLPASKAVGTVRNFDITTTPTTQFPLELDGKPIVYNPPNKTDPDDTSPTEGPRATS